MVDLTLRLISFPPETSLKMIAKEFLKEKRHKPVSTEKMEEGQQQTRLSTNLFLK